MSLICFFYLLTKQLTMEENTQNTENTAAETATATEPQTTAAPAGDNGGENKRPVFLTVLCILTFIGSGLGLLSSLLMIAGVGALSSYLGSFGGIAAGGTAYFGVSALLAAGSLFGAIMMWKLKKTGFYLYVAANIIAAILPMVWLGSAFAILGFIWPVIFIVLYAINLKHLK